MDYSCGNDVGCVMAWSDGSYDWGVSSATNIGVVNVTLLP
jgi:hypothetical protein